MWFDVRFPGNEEVVLDTSPNAPRTHWKQTVFYLEDVVGLRKNDLIEVKMGAWLCLSS